MKRSRSIILSVCGGLILWMGIWQISLAGEPPHLELVRGLRMEGLSDLALEYLNKIKGTQDKALQQLLPLEFARTRLELARSSSDDQVKQGMLDAASAELDSFIKANPKHQLIPVALIEKAKLTSYRGRQILNKARRADNKDDRQAQIALARPLYTRSAQEFDAAVKGLTSQIKGLSRNKKTEKSKFVLELEQIKFRAEIDQANMLMQLAETINGDDPKSIEERGRQLKAARKLFESISKREVNTEEAWVAKAWLAECDQLTESFDLADKEFQDLLKETNVNARAGIRLAKSFKIRHIFENKDPSFKGNQITAVINLSNEWLNQYPRYRLSPEGLRIMYMYARALQRDAISESKRDKSGKIGSISATGITKLKKAESIFKELTEFDNEYTDLAETNRMNCIILRTDALRDKNKGEVGPDNLNNFEDAYLQALVTRSRLKQNSGKLDPRKEYTRVSEFLERALSLRTNKDSQKEVSEAEGILAFTYYYLNEPHLALMRAERFVRNNPTAKQAVSLASLTLEAYNQIMNLIKRSDLSPEEQQKSLQVDSERMKSFIQFIEKNFAKDPVADYAHYRLANLYKQDKQYEQAIESYRLIRPTYNGIAQVRLEEGASLFWLFYKNFAETLKAKEHIWQEGIKDLDQLPLPNNATEKGAAATAIQVKIQLAQLYELEGKNYAAVENIGKSLQGVIPTLLQVDEKVRSQLLINSQILALNGSLGRAYLLLKAKQFTPVLQIIDPLIDANRGRIEKAGEGSTPEDRRLDEVLRKMLVMALRCNVQENKIDAARKRLELLQKGKGGTDNLVTVLQQLIGTIQGQIQALRNESKSDEADKLSEGFANFLGDLAKQPTISKELKLFLARGYSGIEKYDRALELLDQLSAYQFPEPKDKDQELAQKKFKYQVDFQIVRNARLSKDYKRAEQNLNQMIGTPSAKGVAYASIEVRKERAMWYEDQKKYREAVSEWLSIAKMFGTPLPPYPPKDGQAAAKRTIYFNLYFEAQRCSAHAYNDLDPKKYASRRDDGLGKVAQKLIDLENIPDLTSEIKNKMIDTLNEYPILKKQYLQKGGKLLGAAQ